MAMVAGPTLPCGDPAALNHGGFPTSKKALRVNEKKTPKIEINTLTGAGQIRQVVRADDDATTYSG